jgi:hypothetical protein
VVGKHPQMAHAELVVNRSHRPVTSGTIAQSRCAPWQTRHTESVPRPSRAYVRVPGAQARVIEEGWK